MKVIHNKNIDMMKNTFVGMMVLVGITMMMAGCSEKRAVHDVVKEDVAGSTPSVRDISVAHKIYVQRDSDGIYCYADGLKIDLPDWQGVLAAATYEMGNYVYVVGDQCPCGNGFTIRFALYQVHKYSLAIKDIGTYPAIHFDKNGYRVAVPRVKNPEADWANQVIVMHDEYYDTDGKQTRKDNREYSYEEMEKKYGKDLLNVHGLSMYDNNE